MILTDKEKVLISSFVEKVKKFNIVNGVYMMPYILRRGEERIDVVSIKTTSCSQLFNTRDIEFELENRNLELMLKEFNKPNDSNKLIQFRCNDSGYYSPLMLRSSEKKSMQELVGSAILFDRTGSYKTLKERMQNSIPTYPYICKIDDQNVENHSIRR